ncbi:MAG: SUMF1/EgtB/PvdO family nonheme iron enzyme [Candidatus Zixiibacteriota bacterium]
MSLIPKILILITLTTFLIFNLACSEDDDDNTGPDIQIINPSDGAHVIDMVQIDVEADDDSGISSIEIFFDDESVHTAMSSPASYIHNLSSYEMGTVHQIYAKAIDGEANVSNSETIEILIDNFGLTVTEIRQRSVELSWNRIDESGFAHYLVMQSETEGVNTDDTEAGRITDALDTVFTINGLEPASHYYFKVFAITIDDTMITNEINTLTQEATETDNDTEMVYIPTTTFTRGNVWGGIWGGNDDIPAERITVSAFYIDKYEVTYRRYQEFIDVGGYETREYWSEEGWTYLDNLIDDPPKYWDDERFHVDEDYPVVGISYYEAEAFANWAGKRLPTEAEWELAARGNGGEDITGDGNPDGIMYPWGNQFHPDGLVMCNYLTAEEHGSDGYSDGFEKNAPIGSFPDARSPFGLHDMSGNVAEWCYDWWDVYYYETAASTDPQGPTSGDRKVLRGGSFNDVSPPDSVQAGFNFRTFTRNKRDPDDQRHYIGFRLAKDAD